MLKPSWSRFVLTFLLTSYLSAAHVNAQDEKTKLLGFVDTDEISKQLYEYQQSSLALSQTEFEQGLQNQLKMFPGAAYQLLTPQPQSVASSAEKNNIESGLTWINRDSSWYVSQVYPGSVADQKGILVGDKFLGTDKFKEAAGGEF